MKRDPYEKVRRDNPPPDYPIKPKTKYNRGDNKRVVDDELEEWEEELKELGVEI